MLTMHIWNFSWSVTGRRWEGGSRDPIDVEGGTGQAAVQGDARWFQESTKTSQGSVQTFTPKPSILETMVKTIEFPKLITELTPHRRRQLEREVSSAGSRLVGNLEHEGGQYVHLGEARIFVRDNRLLTTKPWHFVQLRVAWNLYGGDRLHH